jgi:plastocyanin
VFTLIILVALSACSGSTSPAPTTPPAAPSVTITSPTGNVIPQIGDVTVSVQVSNFKLVEIPGAANVAGEGHIHYFLDVDPPTTPGVPAVTAAGTYAMTTATSYTWHNVGGGPHKFSVELVNNDDTPLVPPVVATVSVTVQAASPTPSPTLTPTPTPTPTPSGSSVTIDLIAKSFAFDKKTITVPAGAQVTVNFDNQDSGIPHNFAVYTNSSASTSIFVGQIISGPKTITYKFTAPATPGTYFFRCDVHPTTMTGSFVVQ